MIIDDGKNVYIVKRGIITNINSVVTYSDLNNFSCFKDKLLENNIILDDYIKHYFYYNKDNVLIYTLLFDDNLYIKNFFILNKNDLYNQIIDIICSNEIITIIKRY
jgi:hypothetical protein